MGSRQLSTICESIEAVLINTIQVRQNNYTNIADFYLYMYLKVVQFKTFFYVKSNENLDVHVN